MAKKVSYKEMVKNQNLDNFCSSNAKCPECGTELDCDDSSSNTVIVCSACGWKNY